MADLGDRLVRCFSSVFPTLTGQEIRTANVESLANVDSLASVTLLAVIGEEFGVQMDLDALLRLGTFQNIQQYLHELSGSTLAPNKERTE